MACCPVALLLLLLLLAAVDMSVMYRLQRRIFECRVHALFCANIK